MAGEETVNAFQDTTKRDCMTCIAMLFYDFIIKKKSTGISSREVIGQETERMAVHSLSPLTSFANYTIISHLAIFINRTDLCYFALRDLGDNC